MVAQGRRCSRRSTPPSILLTHTVKHAVSGGLVDFPKTTKQSQGQSQESDRVEERVKRQSHTGDGEGERAGQREGRVVDLPLGQKSEVSRRSKPQSKRPQASVKQAAGRGGDR
jgi:hypothetical protein